MKQSRLIWVPRVLVLSFTGFMTLFSLDSFSGKDSFLMELAGFLIHLVPVFLLVGVLVFTWNRPRIGGILLLLVGAGFTVFFESYQELSNFLVISLPVILPGLLFIGVSFIPGPRAA